MGEYPTKQKSHLALDSFMPPFEPVGGTIHSVGCAERGESVAGGDAARTRQRAQGREAQGGLVDRQIACLAA